MRKFWMVVKSTREGLVFPYKGKRHFSEEEAQTEAVRLLHKENDFYVKFIVFEAKDVVRLVPPEPVEAPFEWEGFKDNRKPIEEMFDDDSIL